MPKSIEIEFAENGDVKIEAVGFKGQGCEAATKAIEEALGIVKDRKKKPEYNQQVVGQQKQRA
jgi:NifU-like protein involved in Fe-S cluster formation